MYWARFLLTVFVLSILCRTSTQIPGTSRTITLIDLHTHPTSCTDHVNATTHLSKRFWGLIPEMVEWLVGVIGPAARIAGELPIKPPTFGRGPDVPLAPLPNPQAIPPGNTITTPPEQMIPSTTTSSSSSSTSSSNCVCIGCPDQPTPLPILSTPEHYHEEPWFKGTGQIFLDDIPTLPFQSDHSSATANLSVTTNTHDELRNRQLRIRREIKVCGGVWTTSPRYTAWSLNADIPKLPYYSYEISTKCLDYNFKLSKSNGPLAGKLYATEHVYEIHLLRDFLRWRFSQDDVQAYIKRKRLDAECGAFRLIFWPRGEIFDKADFDGVIPLENMADQLAGDDTPGELFYLEANLNSVKAVVMTEDRRVRSYKDPYWKENLIEAAKVQLVREYLHDSAVQMGYQATSTRIYKFFVKLDKVLNTPSSFQAGQSADNLNDMLKTTTMDFARNYKKWEKQLILKLAEQAHEDALYLADEAMRQVEQVRSVSNQNRAEVEKQIKKRKLQRFEKMDAREWFEGYSART